MKALSDEDCSISPALEDDPSVERSATKSAREDSSSSTAGSVLFPSLSSLTSGSSFGKACSSETSTMSRRLDPPRTFRRGTSTSTFFKNHERTSTATKESAPSSTRGTSVLMLSTESCSRTARRAVNPSRRLVSNISESMGNENCTYLGWFVGAREQCALLANGP